MRYRTTFSIQRLGSTVSTKLTRSLPVDILAEEQNAFRITQRLLFRPGFRTYSSRQNLTGRSNGLSKTAEPSHKSWNLFRDQTTIPNEDIYIHNLEGTIKAHHNFNARPKLRKFWSKAGDGHSAHILPTERDAQQVVYRRGFRRNIRQQDQAQESDSKSKESKDHWPRGSPQYEKLSGQEDSPRKDEVCEYRSRVFEPEGSFSLGELCEDIDSPWRSLIMHKGGDGYVRLAAEISAFERYMRLDRLESRAAAVIRNKIALYVKKAHPGSRIKVIGSYSTGLGTPLSDMDFTVILPEFEKDPLQRGPSSTRPKARKARTRAMMRFKAILDRNPKEWTDVEVVWATIPLIIGTHRESRITVQLQQQKGSMSVFLDFTAFEAFQSEFPTLRSLYILLKTALAVRGLDKTFSGGLSSYPLLIAIVNALKHCEHKYPREDVANHLLYVLRFYSRSNLYQTGFRLDQPRVFPKLGTAASRLNSAEKPDLEGIAKIATPNPQQPYLLCLQDPLNPNNDLGKKAYAIKHIQELFRAALKQIESSMQQWESMTLEERRMPTDLILDVLVKANYEKMEEDRAKRRGYAEQMPHPLDWHKGQRS